MEVGDTLMPYMEVSFHLVCNENFVGNCSYPLRSRVAKFIVFGGGGEGGAYFEII